MYRRFYIRYYINGVLTQERLRRWAAANQHIFPEYGFTNTNSDFPTTHQIAFRLKNRFDFETMQGDNEVILINNNRNFSNFND